MIPKKLRNHFIKFLTVTVIYLEGVEQLHKANLLMNLVSKSDFYDKGIWAVSMIYALITIWFCWRFYTGMIRDGDFLE